MALHGFPGQYGKQRETGMWSGSTPASPTAITIAAAATIGVPTATPVVLIASTTFDTTWVRITNVAALANSGLRGDVTIEIMAGGAGAEVPIIGPLLFGGRPAYSSYTLPITIPAGTRITARVAAGVASRSTTWMFETFGSPNRHMDEMPSRWIGYGVTVTSGAGAYGTAITPGNTNTWGSWTAIGAGTTYAHRLWLPMVAIRTATVITAQSYATQFAIASTTDAATELTNSTGVFRGPNLTGSTTEQLGGWLTATNPVRTGVEDLIYAPMNDGAAISCRALATGTADANALGVAMLGAVM